MIQQRAGGKGWLKTVVILLALGGGAFLLRQTVFRAQPVPVTVFRAEKGRVEDSVVNSRAGTVQSRRRAGMSPGIAGLVSEIKVEKGSRVKKGDVLLRLDDREQQAQVQLAMRSLEAAKALAEQARLEADLAQRLWNRTQSLARNDVVSETVREQDHTRFLSTQAASKAAGARVLEAEAALEAARATLAKTVIAAPFDGVVLDVTIEVGEWISPSPPGVFIPPIVDLIDPRALYLSAPMDEADVARLHLGLPTRITLDAFRDQSFAGTLTYIASFVEARQEQNRTLRIEAELKDTTLPANLLPGLSADLEVILDSREQVLRIPTYALLDGSRVLVVQNGRLEERKVGAGLHNWSYTEITSGLSAGELVVVSLDRPEVKAGARVTVSAEAEK
ncbi:MAG: efflux RND transporter periplasmic adaptor subunit [Verrucomicrobia bacterium]|nr:efflux RND transporter periplasmic adaptor subunit [Verrucomicrobiota bacterium]